MDGWLAGVEEEEKGGGGEEEEEGSTGEEEWVGGTVLSRTNERTSTRGSWAASLSRERTRGGAWEGMTISPSRPRRGPRRRALGLEPDERKVMTRRSRAREKGDRRRVSGEIPRSRHMR